LIKLNSNDKRRDELEEEPEKDPMDDPEKEELDLEHSGRDAKLVMPKDSISSSSNLGE